MFLDGESDVFLKIPCTGVIETQGEWDSTDLRQTVFRKFDTIMVKKH